MYLKTLRLKGYRNFKSISLELGPNAAVIVGRNDIGKTNLLHSLRILLDASIPETELEPSDSDFFAFKETHKIEILLSFEEVTEDCVIAVLGKYRSDDGRLHLCYRALRDPMTKKKTYEILAGSSIADLQALPGRIYLRVMNLKYLKSTRELASFIRKERSALLRDAKESRDDAQKLTDETTLEDVQGHLDNASNAIVKLSYVNSATNSVNQQLRLLSCHHKEELISFGMSTSDPEDFLENLHLVSKVGEQNLVVGGDGRNNQIFVSIWTSRNRLSAKNPLEVNFLAIEEPEAHLHPHQQRKLARYLAESLPSQVILTTHSPQIACEFSPGSIALLSRASPKSGTVSPSGGCSKELMKELVVFGHRLNIVPAEAFFSRVVLLVEGPSEVLFYRALAAALNIDLDEHSISVVSVDGVGFSPILKLVSFALGIDFVVRTDNDFFGMKTKGHYRAAGVERAVKIYRNFVGAKPSKLETVLASDLGYLRWINQKAPPPESLKAINSIRKELESVDLYVADADLETDLANSPLLPQIKSFSETGNASEAVESMVKKKATFMYRFLGKHSSDLTLLENHSLALPVKKAYKLASQT